MFSLTPYRNRRYTPAMQNQAMRDFDDFFNRMMWAPEMFNSRSFRDFDLYEEDGKMNLCIEAPGVNPEEVEIRTTKDSVSIRSKKETEEKEGDKEEGKTWYNKKSTVSFNYEVTLPFEIDTEKAEATFENGVIKIAAPRLQASESKVLPLKKA